MKKYLLILLTLIIFCQPVLVLAQEPGDDQTFAPRGGSNLIDKMKTVIESTGIELEGGNPNQPELVVSKIINAILSFLGIIFFILIIYAGILWMTASGNEEKITKAKKILVSSAIGIGIVLGAYLITYLIVDVLRGATLQP